MPIIKSAKKRVRVANRATARNVRTKRSLRTSIKSFVTKPSSTAISQAQKDLDKAVKKGLIHKNKAARQKKRLSAQAKAAGIKNSKSAAKPSVKKPASKKPAAAKTPAKKPTAKKK